MRLLLVGLALLAACRAPEARRPAAAARTTWALVELESSGSALALVRVPFDSRRRPARAVVEAPEEASVGEIFEVRVGVTGAEAGETRRYRLIPIRPGLRFPDGDEVTITGAGSVKVRVVADSAGPAGIRATEVR